MDIAFWASRWNEGRIGFHEGKANELLAAYAAKLGEGRNVLVPLCGKTEDMAYLAARGHHVVGIEAIEPAALAFYAEHQLTPTKRAGNGVTIYEAAGITILAGDVFAATLEDVGSSFGPVDALYDRAALIALPPDVRPRYAKKCAELLSPGAKGLLVTLEYPEGATTPPPHSVPESEVRALYNDVETLVRRDARDERFKDGKDAAYLISF